VNEDVELIASSFALVEPIDDLNPRFLQALLVKCLVKVGWTQEHFVNVLQSQLESKELEPHGVVALAVIGDMLTSMLFDYGADKDFTRKYDIEEFKPQLREYYASGDCEDGAMDIWMFAHSIREMSPDDDQTSVAVKLIIRVMNLYHPAMITGSASAGKRSSSSSSSSSGGGGGGDLRHKSLNDQTNACHVFTMLFPESWLIDCGLIQKQRIPFDLPPMILESTALCYPLVKPQYVYDESDKVKEYWMNYSKKQKVSPPPN